MTDRELMQQALDAMEFIPECGSMIGHVAEMKRVAAVAALRDRLAQSEQGPVAWQGVHDKTDLYYRKPPQTDVRPLYTNPRRQWVGLTDKELEAMAEKYVTNCYFDTLKYARAIEAKLKDQK